MVKKGKLNRRSFFRTVTLSTGALMLSPVKINKAVGSPKNTSSDTIRRSAYHLTPHIRKYYKTAGK